MVSDQKLTYKSSGVNYDLLDNLKRMAQTAGAKLTIEGLMGESRGESAAVLDLGVYKLAFVQEGLGTKNLIADAMAKITPDKTYYDAIAQDTIAMIVNDLITVGARPWAIGAYWAIGSDNWLKNEKRMKDLVDGWENACRIAGAGWIGGETPILNGIIHSETIDLGGTGIGVIDKSNKLTLGQDLQPGDVIIVFGSSGIHANGLSLARKLAETLPDGYETKVKGRMYGELLLEPTIIYAKLIQELFANGVAIHYMVNITGHGWRKIMRYKKEYTYRIKNLPPVPDVLAFIQEKAGLSDQEAYGNFNMGAGYAVIVPSQDLQKVIGIAKTHGIEAYHVGIVEQGVKQVVIEPISVTFAAESLQVRI